MTPRGEPPRIARTLLERALPGDVRDYAIADVDEMFARRVQCEGGWRARVWYWWQVVSFVGRFSVERLRGSVRRARPHGGTRTWRRSLPPISLLEWKLGFRMLARYPWLSLISGVALAVAIGIGVGFFHMIRQDIFPNLGLQDGDRIVRLDLYDVAAGRTRPTTARDFLEWRDALTSVVELSAYRTVERNFAGTAVQGRPLMVAEITPSAFSLARVPPLLGRALTESDALPGAPDVVVLGFDVWATRLERDPNVLGREVQLGRTHYTVVGVMPPGFGFPRSHEGWVPLRTGEVTTLESGPAVHIFGRLTPGVTRRSAQSELATLGTRTIRADFGSQPPLRPRVIHFAAPDPAGDNLTGAILANLLFVAMLGAVSANVATLVFARTAVRESEIIVRTALGASRARIGGQLFVEALVLASISAVVGLVGARAFLEYAWQFQMAERARIPYWWTPSFDVKTVLYTAGLAVLGAAFVALLPALKATGGNLQHGLKITAAGATNLRFGGIWTAIIVFQVAFTVVSLPFGIGYARDVWRSHQMRAAFAAERYLSFELALDGNTDRTDTLRTNIAHTYEELSRRLSGEPGVEGVTFGSGLPGMPHRAAALELEATGARIWPYHASVDVDYFNVFDVPVVAGRGLRSGDVADANTSVLVNESLARSLGPSPIGRRLRRPGVGDQVPGPWLEVVGVVRNMGTEVYDRDPTHGTEREAGLIYRPVAPTDVSRLFVGVKTRDPAALSPRVREIARQIDPGIRLYDVLPLDAWIRQYDRPEVLAAWSGVGGILLCILLSAAGLFAVMALAVARRTREIGIRLALGASHMELLAALFGRAARQLGMGIAAGLTAVLLITVAFDRLQPEILPPLFAVAAFMTLVGFLACAVPARRALSVQPTEALKQH